MMIMHQSIIVVISTLAILNHDVSGFVVPNNIGATSARSQKRSSSSSLSMSAALIVQNKGGGHGELGFQLAKTLTNHPKITSITILQDSACKDDTEPFKSYSTDIPDVKIVKTDLSADDENCSSTLMSLLGTDTKFDYVWDNASKGPVGMSKAICDMAKKEWDVKLYTYVSSAGMYQPTEETEFPMSEETTPIKESAGQAKFDKYALDIGLPLVSFRPQYIYGPQSNKNDYIDWYFDRIVRDLPIPIPGDGEQFVSLTNSQDVASVLSSVLNDEEAAKSQTYFNCGSDNLVSYNDVAYLCAESAGISKDKINIQHYDAEKLGKATFPFRISNFYVAPTLVKEKLKWEGATHTLKDDLTSFYYDSYVARGGPTKELSLEKDNEVLQS